MLGLTVAPRPSPPFDNELSENVDFECDPGYGIYRVVSEFGEQTKRTASDADRRWGFECKKVLSGFYLYRTFLLGGSQRLCIPTCGLKLPGFKHLVQC